MGRSKLHVEGKDDMNVIGHLLDRHGVEIELDDFQVHDSVEKLLNSIRTTVKLSGGLPVGFVLDADEPDDHRWESVVARLKQVGIDAPTKPPSTGFIGKSTLYETTAGIWLMPDNQNHGELENFLRGLIPDDNALYQHAAETTATARTEHQAKFRPEDELKATLHAYLAWQEEPGLPYGTAIKAQYFNHKSPAALAFINWFKKLYQID